MNLQRQVRTKRQTHFADKQISKRCLYSIENLLDDFCATTKVIPLDTILNQLDARSPDNLVDLLDIHDVTAGWMKIPSKGHAKHEEMP